VSAKLRATLGTLVAQLFFIAAGVYLGNQADDWKQERGHRRAARATLENFRTEVRRNREQVAQMLGYHAAMRDTLSAILRGDAEQPMDQLTRRFRYGGNKEFTGIGGVEFSTTAWELALATQALAYVEARLAFRVADAYSQQRTFAGIQSAFMQNIFAPAAYSAGSSRPMGGALRSYLGDASYQEGALLRKYDRLLPGIDSALARLPK